MEIDFNATLTSKETKKQSYLFSGLDYACTAITSLVLYWLFSKFTQDSSFYNGIGCNKLLSSSKKLERFYYYLFLTYLGMLVLNILSIYNKSLDNLTEYTRVVVLLFSFFLGLFFLFKLTFDINLGESCGELRCLALVVAIIGWIGITLFSLLFCVSLAMIIKKKN